MFTTTIDILNVTDPNACWEPVKGSTRKFATAEEATDYGCSFKDFAPMVQVTVWNGGQCFNRFNL